MSRWTLRRRLLVILVGLLVAVAGAIGVVSTLALQRSLVAQLDQRLDASTQRAFGDDGRTPVPRTDDDASAVRGRGGTQLDENRPPRPPGLVPFGQEAGTATLSVDDGIEQTGLIQDDGTVRALTAGQADALRTVDPDGEPHTIALPELGSYRVQATTSPDGGIDVIGLPVADADATVRDFLLTEVILAVAGLAIATIAGGALIRRELRPLEQVAATATRVAELPLHEGEVAVLDRVPDADTDPGTEVGQVGLALNRLLGHVEAALGARHASETQVRQFVADASHELRTPLASIRGYAELVRRMRADIPPDALHAMERVESESRRMTALVEDMLLLARLDAGRPLARAEVDITALALDAVADAHAAAPDHVWRLDIPTVDDDAGAGAGSPQPDGGDDADDGDLPPTVVLGDEDRLRQVLVNLLANARVHTPAGTTVVVSVRRRDEDVVLQVTDDGPGIPAALRHRLFQRFTRGDAARTPGSGSTGLGLAIVRAVVESHSGTIVVDSAQGSTAFTVTLPAATNE
jgi:two-component system OmpR family sensor kinase